MEDLRRAMRRRWNPDDVPGAVAGITLEGERAVAALGETSIEHPLPVTDETLFQIGSVTKTFTGLTLLCLVARGALSLDAPVRSYLPGFRVLDEHSSQQVTPRHLLTHLAGWEGDFFVNTGPGPDALATYAARMSELPQLVPAGSHFSYSNSAFCLAGHLIEHVSGLSFEQAVQKFVLDPLDLQSTFFEAADVITRRFAVGHIITDQSRKVARPWALPRCIYPAGGIVTNVADLLTYAEFHLDTNKLLEPLLSSELRDALRTPQHWLMPDNEAIALAWFVEDWSGERVLSHKGSTNGQIASLFLVPDRGFAVTVLTNSYRGAELTWDITRWAMTHYLGIEPSIPALVELGSDELQQYAGRYSRPFADVEVSVVGDRLLVQPRYKLGFPSREDAPPPDPPPELYAACGDDRFFADGGHGPPKSISFFRDGDEQITHVRAMNRVHRRVA